MTEIVAVEKVPGNSTYLFRVRGVDSGEEREAILVRLDGEVACWSNCWRHTTHVKLDEESGATIRDGEIICRNHGAMFETDTGFCTFGPCEEAYLEAVAVAVEDGAVHLDDPDHEYVGPGPIGEDPADLSSTPNLEF